MSDDVLIGIDEAFARARRRPRRPIAPPPHLRAVDDAGEAAIDDATAWYQPLWLTLFLAVQFLWGVLLFIPGIQMYRGIIRGLPYVSGLGILGLYFVRRARTDRPHGTALLVGALVLLVANLLHPTSQLSAGLAQCMFQLSIAAPMFWAYKMVQSPRQLERLLVFVLVMNFASAVLGVLQVYYPDRYMPEFSQQLSADWVESMSYIGDDGRVIMRPPGLTDTPGGAALAGGLAALLGLGLSLRSRKTWQTAAYLGMAGIGLVAIYLTQARSVFLMTLVGAASIGLVAAWRGRLARASWVVAIGGVLLIASFVWATSIGGSTVESRFLGIRDTGALRIYQENRGNFLAYTIDELVDRFPLGAGVGRWGMMNVYFGDQTEFRSTPIHVEIQLTGWLLDGGVPMWILYGGAVLLALLASWRLTGALHPATADAALIVLAIHVFVIGMSFAGPAFNMQLGILFWTLAGAQHGAAFSPPEPYVDAGA